MNYLKFLVSLVVGLSVVGVLFLASTAAMDYNTEVRSTYVRACYGRDMVYNHRHSACIDDDGVMYDVKVRDVK